MRDFADYRAYLKKRAISASYPLSRLLPIGPYEQAEFWVSDALKICYIVNPKVACSSIRVALTEAVTGKKVERFEHNHPLVSSFRRTSFRSVPASYFCFTFVRHPVDRLISFYKDKFLKPRLKNQDFEYRLYLRGIFHPSDDFDRVCRLVGIIPDELSDRHFVSQHYWLDSVCKARADFVGHFEQIDEGWATICRHIGISASLPRLNSTASVPFSPAVPKVLIDRYAADLEKFSYSI